MNRKIAAYAIFRHFLALFVLLSAFFGASSALATDDLSILTGQPQLQTPVPTGRLVIRLTPTAGVRMGAAGLVTRQDFNNNAESFKNQRRITRLVANINPQARLMARMPTAARMADGPGAAPSSAHLARYAQFETGVKDPLVLAKLAAQLQSDAAVDLAWVEPVAIPATLGFGETNRGPVAVTDTDSDSFEQLQGYLDDAPDGIGALSMRSQAGALGAGVTVIDVEGGWLWGHEDLPAPVAEIGDQIDEQSWRNHGTAVVGVIRGQDNGLGMTGIAPLCAVGSSSIGSQATSEAILAAGEQLGAGDVIVIELHAPGPEATGNGQQGYVPMEFWQDNFDAIQTVTHRGIMVLEAAGNGQVDLDAAIYQGLFDPSQRHSGAIMVGATNGSDLDPAWFTNHGQRVDLNGWGFRVATLAYGDLQGAPDFPEAQWYTAFFSGTSSATPVVTGAVVSLTGMVRARHGFDLDARLARDLLRLTGTTSNGPKLIGARPDLVAAYALAADGIGQISGVVSDQQTGFPVAGVLVAAAGGGSATLTASDGSWRLPLLAGPVTLEFSEFAYESETTTATIPPGGSATLSVALAPLARVNISGIVLGEGLPLAGARLEPVRLPLTPVTSQSDGSFVLAQVPVGNQDHLLVYGVPGFGARLVGISTVGAIADVIVNPTLGVSDENFSPNDGGFVSSQGLWTHGIPPVAVTGGAFSGDQCWGIGMDGLGYADDQADTLTSPVYDLSAIDNGPYFLSFHYFQSTEANYDGVNVEISTGGPFTVLEPEVAYPDRSLGGLEYQPGWSGESERWTGTVFDLSELTGGPFQFRFHFGSDGGVTSSGFFIDGITFDHGLAATPVPEPVPGAGPARLTAWPNPFNPAVTIAYVLSRPGPLEVSVFDLRGRRVARLHDGMVAETQGQLRWDGRDDTGRSLASGVYLVRLQGPSGDQARQRIVLTK